MGIPLLANQDLTPMLLVLMLHFILFWWIVFYIKISKMKKHTIYGD